MAGHDDRKETLDGFARRTTKVRHVRFTRSGSYSLDSVLRNLRPKQHEVDNVQPAQNAVDDCPEYRMVVGVRYRDGKSAAKAHAIFRTFDSNSVVAISVHVAALPAWVRNKRPGLLRISRGDAWSDGMTDWLLAGVAAT
jgi:hypothetical protein